MPAPQEEEAAAVGERPQDSPGRSKGEEEPPPQGQQEGDERSERKSSKRSRSRSRGRKSSRRSRSRSRERSRRGGSSRSRSRDRERSRKSSRRSRSRSRSDSPGARRRRRRKERGSNWDKPPEGGVPPAGLLGLGSGAPGGLGGPSLGSGTYGPGSSMPPPPPPGPVDAMNGLTPEVMMGQAPPPPGLTSGPLRGAIGTLSTPTAPAHVQELFNGVLIPLPQIRQAKRLYIGNTPIGIDQVTLLSLFNQAMVAAGKGTAEEPPVVGVQVSESKPFAFIETRTPQDACNALLFDGLAIGGNVLKVRRPKDYKPLPGIVDPPVGSTLVPGAVPTTVSESESKIYLGSIPTHFNEMQVRELVSAFGELRAFNLVKDVVTGNSRGFCFFEYADPALTDRVCQELNGFELGDRKLTCQRANTGPRGQPIAGGMQPGSMAGGDPYAALMGMAGMGVGMGAVPALPPLPPPTRILKLSNMVVAEELKDDAEYEEIVTDIREECSKYGPVLSLKVPRPSWKEDGAIDVMPPAVGEVFVEFSEPDGAHKAGMALRNRQFSGRTVTCSFHDEGQYAEGVLA